MRCSLIDSHFDSVDELNFSLRENGWEAEFKQLASGVESAAVTALVSEKLRILRVSLSGAVHQLGAPPADFLSFGLMVSPRQAGRFGRHLFDAGALLNFNTSAGLDAVSKSGFVGYGVSIHESLLSDSARDQSAREHWSGLQSVKQLGNDVTDLRMLIDGLFKAAAEEHQLRIEETQLEDRLPLALHAAWEVGTDPIRVHSLARTRVLTDALDYIRSQASEHFTVAQMCAAIGTSISTLERVFQSHFGVSPKRYLQLSRLSAARRSLLDPWDERSVTAVAEAQGFWHMSKFAADYRHQFGELPSVTRKSTFSVQ